MRPESTDVTLRADLAIVAQEYQADKAQRKFIGSRVAPIFRTPEIAGEYPIMRRANFKKPVVDNRRRMGAPYNKIVGQFGSGNYSCEQHGLEYPIDDRLVRRYSNYFDAEAQVTKMTVFQHMLLYEIRVAALMSGGGWTNHNVGTAWSTVASGVPLDDIQTGIDALCDNCGAGPEDISLVIPRADFQEMIRTTQVVNKTLYTYPGIQPANLQAQQVAAMLGIKEVLVGRSNYDSTEEGVAESNAQIWTAGTIYVAVIADEDAPLEEPSVARTILCSESASDLGMVGTRRDGSIDSNVVRVSDDTDELLMGETDLFCYQLTNT